MSRPLITTEQSARKNDACLTSCLCYDHEQRLCSMQRARSMSALGGAAHLLRSLESAHSTRCISRADVSSSLLHQLDSCKAPPLKGTGYGTGVPGCIGSALRAWQLRGAHSFILHRLCEAQAMQKLTSARLSRPRIQALKPVHGAIGSQNLTSNQWVLQHLLPEARYNLTLFI